MSTTDPSTPSTAAAASAPVAAPAVELRGITKAYPGVVANADIDLAIHAGEVHALLGENGAGKSTLIGILAGIQQPDSGEIALRGRRVRIGSPRESCVSPRVRLIAIPPSWFMPASNETRVRVEAFSNTMASVRSRSGW